MIELPAGYYTAEDETICHYLINDPVFKRSAEEDLGPIMRIYPDWKENKLVYVTLTTEVCHNLRELLDYAKGVGYLKTFQN